MDFSIFVRFKQQGKYTCAAANIAALICAQYKALLSENFASLDLAFQVLELRIYQEIKSFEHGGITNQTFLTDFLSSIGEPVFSVDPGRPSKAYGAMVPEKLASAPLEALAENTDETTSRLLVFGNPSGNPLLLHMGILFFDPEMAKYRLLDPDMPEFINCSWDTLDELFSNRKEEASLEFTGVSVAPNFDDKRVSNWLHEMLEEKNKDELAFFQAHVARFFLELYNTARYQCFFDELQRANLLEPMYAHYFVNHLPTFLDARLFPNALFFLDYYQMTQQTYPGIFDERLLEIMLEERYFTRYFTRSIDVFLFCNEARKIAPKLAERVLEQSITEAHLDRIFSDNYGYSRLLGYLNKVQPALIEELPEALQALRENPREKPVACVKKSWPLLEILVRDSAEKAEVLLSSPEHR